MEGLANASEPHAATEGRRACELWALALALLVGATALAASFRGPGAVPAEELALIGLLGLFLLLRPHEARLPPELARPAAFLAVVLALSTSTALVSEIGWPGRAFLDELLLRARGIVPLDQLEVYNVARSGLVQLEGLGVMAMAAAILPAGRGRGRTTGVLLGIAGLAVLRGLAERATGLGLPRHWADLEPELRRIGSFFEDPNVFGSFLCLVLPLVGAAAARGRPLRAAALGLGGAVWACLLLTWSRAAVAAALVGLALALRRRVGGRRAAALVLSGLLLSAAGLAALQASALRFWLGKTFGAQDLETVLEGRLQVWQVGVSMVADFPMLGSGLGSVFRRYALYREDPAEQSEGVGPDPALEGRNLHNTILQLAAETGLLGLAGFAWLVGAALVLGFRASGERQQRWSRAAAAGVALFLLTGLTGHPLLRRDAALLFWLSCGLAASGRAGRPAKGPTGGEAAPRPCTPEGLRPPRWVVRGLWTLLAAGGGLHVATSVWMGQGSLYEMGVYGHPAAWKRIEEQSLSWPGASRPKWSWAGRRVELSVPARGPACRLRVLVRHPDLARDPLQLEVRVNGELRLERRIRVVGPATLLVPLLPSELDGSPVHLCLETSRTFVPSQGGNGADQRPLGVALGVLEFVRGAEASGLHPAELNGRWSRLYLEGRMRTDRTGPIRFEVAHPDLEREALQIRLYAAGRLVTRREATRAGRFEVPLGDAIRAGEQIRLELSRTWSPMRYALSADSRELGVFFAHGELEGGPVEFESGPAEGERRERP